MDDAVKAELEKAIVESPRVPGVDWGWALTTAILRELEEMHPGFREAVRERIKRSAAKMAESDDPEDREDAPSMAELAESWVFTE